MKHRVVVTGMGVVSPNAYGLDEFETALRNGQSGIRFIPRLADLNFACRIGGVPDNFEAVCERRLTKKQRLHLSDNMAYASVAALDAWEDAGLAIPETEPDWDSGVILGCGISDTETIATTIVPAVTSGNVRRMGGRVVEKVMGSATSARVAGLLGLGNQVTSNSSACSTGTEALVEANWKIRHGLAKRMVVGGSEAPSPFTWGGFDSMKVLSRKFNDQPEKGSRPMSASAGGFVPGAGAGVLVLENLETAMARNARIYAEILGGFVNCGGQRNGGTMTAPNHAGVLRCIRGAMDDAGITPAMVDAVSGHLTATFADPYEIRNWSAALGRGPENFPYVNAAKSMIGHCLGAAGAIESIAAILELHKGFLHPSINCEDLHPELIPYRDRIVRECLEHPDIRIIAKASFGFGDVNSSVIIRKWGSDGG
ncbi:MAG: beta-ketoacyl-[acyl-carrier-protein] synthase family protein [Thermodesulfobacteriota bacterium]